MTSSTMAISIATIITLKYVAEKNAQRQLYEKQFFIKYLTRSTISISSAATTSKKYAGETDEVSEEL